jgi:glucose/arabinose dehydrogenase
MTTMGIVTCACMCFCPAQIFAAQTPSDATVIASGLLGPRGLSFGPDHDLYIAEAGSGGTNATTPAQWARVQVIRRHEFEGRDLAPGFEDRGKYHIVDSKAGFTTVVSVRFGPDGLLYVLELSDAPGFPTPGAGKVVRVKHSGDIEEVIAGLAVPTAMTFGPSGHLYVSNLGAAPAGAGQILKFAITPGW